MNGFKIIIFLLFVEVINGEEHHHRHGQKTIHVDRSPDHLHRKSGSISSPRVLCYTCMSRSMSPLSRAIFMRTLQIPAEAESDFCDDPFNLQLSSNNISSQNSGKVVESIWRMDNSSTVEWKLASFVQPCESSCLKAVLENKHTKIILRGCLTSMYKQISARDYHFIMPPVGSCDEQKHYSKHMGASVTQTCLCSSNYCNITSTTQWNCILFVICILIFFDLNTKFI